MPDREPPVVRVSVAGGLVTRQGPSILDCLEAAMRADPALTAEEAIRTVPVSQATIDRLNRMEVPGED